MDGFRGEIVFKIFCQFWIFLYDLLHWVSEFGSNILHAVGYLTCCSIKLYIVVKLSLFNYKTSFIFLPANHVWQKSAGGLHPFNVRKKYNVIIILNELFIVLFAYKSPRLSFSQPKQLLYWLELYITHYIYEKG